nr:glutathione S-transferase C-terminal domain-containing protein [Limimaricola sp. G21655-S1]
MRFLQIGQHLRRPTSHGTDQRQTRQQRDHFARQQRQHCEDAAAEHAGQAEERPTGHLLDEDRLGRRGRTVRAQHYRAAEELPGERDYRQRRYQTRGLKGLTETIEVTVVDLWLGAEGWAFGGYPGADDDRLNGARHLQEIYIRADPHYTGRATVTVLWDKATGTMVNNESTDILRMLNSGFGDLARGEIDLYPAPLRLDIDALNTEIYPSLNNGVYRTGFATSQEAYEEAFEAVFAMLDKLEARLATNGPFLLGEAFTEADIRLFVTLIRFDAAYHGLFKCNLRRVADYPALSRFLRDVLTIEGVRETVDIDHIKAGYYSISALNPNGIIPRGPDLLPLLSG